MNSSLKAVRRCLFLVSTPMVFLTFALPLRAEDLGASAIEIGALYAIFTACVLVLRPIVGVGVDVFGRRFFFIFALALYFGANVAYALSETVAALYAARLLQGVGFAVLTIATDTITADLTDNADRAEAMGGNIASQTRGGMAGATVAFTLVGVMPAQAWLCSFIGFSIIAFFAVASAMMTIPETARKRPADGKLTKFKMPAGYRRILLIIFIAGFAGALIQPYYLIYLRARFELELYWLAVAFLPMGVAHALLPVWLGRATGRLRRNIVMGAGLAGAAVFYLTIPFIDPFAGVIAAFTGAAIGGVLINLTRNAWVGDLSPPGSTGRTFGLAALAAGAGAAIGPLIGGAAYDRLGPDALFLSAGAALFAATVIALRFRAPPVSARSA